MVSFRGRYLIDRMKIWAFNSLNLGMPVPPYTSPAYWERSYLDATPDTTNEWNDVDHQMLQEYQYQVVSNPIEATTFDKNSNPVLSTTLVETLGLVSPTTTGTNNKGRTNPHYNHKDDQPVLIVGCGKSRMALDMWATKQYKGPIVQVDVSSRIIDIMSQWCHNEIESGDMFVVQDDATELSSLSQDNSIAACVDKGLMDGFFCGSQPNKMEACDKLFTAVHRVLKPSGYFCFWSYTQPKLLLPSLTLPRHVTWQSVQVRHDVTNNVLLYRFQKQAENVSTRSHYDSNSHSNNNKKKKKSNRRRI